jgi:hypothetical protein
MIGPPDATYQQMQRYTDQVFEIARRNNNRAAMDKNFIIYPRQYPGVFQARS